MGHAKKIRKQKMEPKRIKNRLCRQIEAELSSITDPHLSYAGKAEDCPQDLTRENELIDALYILKGKPEVLRIKLKTNPRITLTYIVVPERK